MADDITNPQYILPEDSSRRRSAKVLSGRGVEQPGYRLIENAQEGIADVKVVKQVSQLTGQGPASPRETGRYANMDENVVGVTRRSVSKAVAPNTGSKVVRPPRTALRRMDNSGTGSVGEV